MEKEKKDGRRAEELVAAYLKRGGMKILAKNFRCPFGEIDLVGQDADYLVFIEVKARNTDVCGYPGEALTQWKKMRICQTARFYLAKHYVGTQKPIRFDVVEILGTQIRHTKNAFDYC